MSDVDLGPGLADRLETEPLVLSVRVDDRSIIRYSLQADPADPGQEEEPRGWSLHADLVVADDVHSSSGSGQYYLRADWVADRVTGAYATDRVTASQHEALVAASSVADRVRTSHEDDGYWGGEDAQQDAEAMVAMVSEMAEEFAMRQALRDEGHPAEWIDAYMDGR